MNGSKLKKYLLIDWGTVLVTVLCAPAAAQITPDATLPKASIVNAQGNRTSITGGTEVGSSLFHSFREFSIPTGTSAVFSNGLGIQNIFTRVTGGSVSTIDGLIQANGSANLFLLNPNGILFGANARLNIGGSFVASTADRFVFDNGSEFSATNPQAPPLLTISIKPGLQTGTPTPGSLIFNQATLSVPQNLTLQSDSLAVGRQLTAGQDLTLQATGTVQIRDTPTQPFLAQSGGNLVVQGNLIGIFALNHPQSRLLAQKDLVLRSPNPVTGEARFNTGGNFLIEGFDSSLQSLISSQAVTIRSLGDVSFGSYQGAPLQILAGGSVNIPSEIRIDLADPNHGSVSTVTLSDGTSVAIDSQNEPTVDIRAGMKPEAINLTGITGTTPARADIRLGGIYLSEANAPRIGTVLLTNQFAPDTSLSGDIALDKVSAIATNGNGAQTAIDSRGRLNVNSVLLGFSIYGVGGDTKVLAQGDVFLPYIRNTGEYNSGGSVTISSGGTLNLPGGASTTGFGDGGNVRLTAKGDVTTGGIDSVAKVGNAGSVQITSLTGGIDASTGQIDAYADLPGGSGNAVTLNAEKDIKANFIGTSGGFGGGSGDITLTSRSGNIAIAQGGLFSTTFGTGNAGAIRLKAGQNVEISQSDLVSSAIFNLGGNAQTITIDAGNSIFLNSAALASTSGLESGNVSNTFGLRDLAFNQYYSAYQSAGNAGNVQLKAGRDITGVDSIVASNVVYGSLGNAGNVEISAGNNLTWQRQFSRFTYPGFYAFSRGQGNAGDITIDANSFSLFGSLLETGLSFQAIGQSGDVKISVRDKFLIDGNGWFSAISTGTRPSGKVAESLGDKGNIQIQAGSLAMQNGAAIQTGVGDVDRGYVAGGSAKGNAGNIELNVSGDLSLSQSFIASQIAANGTGNAGKIDIQAGTIRTDRSVITSDTSGVGNANTISLSAESINLNNSDISSAVQPGGIGQGRDIMLNARSIFLNNGAQINTVSSGQGSAGNVQITADRVNIGGLNSVRTPTNFFYAWEPNAQGTFDAPPFPGAFPITASPDFVDGISSGIYSSTNTSSRGGNIIMTARSLSIQDGGAIDARTTSTGNGGTIAISGNQINLQSGGQIGAVATGSGNGGAISLSAADQVQITGSDPTYTDRLAQFGTQTDIHGKARVSNQGASSGVFASTDAQSSGNAGTIAIAAQNVLLSDKGEVSVNSRGSGNGGQIGIAAENIALDRGKIVATTESGEGGNISLTAQNLLTLRRNSQISATANGTGNGGNVDITANGFIVAIPRENSDITANANQGRGGSINITTQFIFGISPESSPPEFSNITASSKFGLNGTVTLNTLKPDPDQKPQQIPQIVNHSNQIAQTCASSARENRFVMTGKGGLPPDPAEALAATQVWNPTETKDIAVVDQSPAIVEATHWVRNADGTVAMLAGARVQPTVPTCAGGR